MFRKHLAGDHLVVDLGLVRGVIVVAVVELDGIGIGNGLLINRVVLAWYGTLARFTLACDHCGIGGQDERRRRLFGLLDFGG